MHDRWGGILNDLNKMNMNKTLFFIFTLSVFSSCIRYDEECLPYYLYSVRNK